jgi:predicted nucleic-acid-binding protein
VIAVDTNVLVRFITQDDAAQAARALRLIAREQIWVAKTVLLEAEWLLGSLYGFDAHSVVDALRKLAGLANIELEDPTAVGQALTWAEAGLDFTDGLHLASRGEAFRFASFDTRLVKRAARLGVPVAAL